ncbi:unnamed protein product [Cuscuta campestris]|uniref:Major facilitator superfamily (MFS) profile domain-containing protein n=1 Tax=Cuscuta campestris TaxID=132261 RepID=A0A484MNC6_9ASTE|nr:unnamed protein product [Cuscuta campestris]
MITTVEESTGETPARLQGKLIATIVCWFLGLGSLVAWNSMLTIGDYYYQLFPDYHPSRVLTLVYQPFAIGAIAILAYKDQKVNTRIRNLVGFSLFSLATFALLMLDVATSGKGGIGPFSGICVLVACFGVADALVQGGVVGDLAFMFLFLAISTFFEFICIILYGYIFPKIPIVKYYRAKAASEGSKTVAADLAAAGLQTNSADDAKQVARLTNWQLFTQNIDYALDLYLIYVLTLSIFPGFLYENTGEHNLGSWYSVVLIAMYNIWDLVSRYTPMIKAIEVKSRKWLMILILSRILLIPCFYFTAKYGDQGWMIFLVSFLGLTNGHLTVCVLTNAPKGYKGPEANALGNILVMSLLCGIFSGVALDWLWLIGHGSF